MIAKFKRLTCIAAAFSVMMLSAPTVYATDKTTEDYVRMDSTVTFDMTESDFWTSLKDDGDKVRYSQKQIVSLNASNPIMNGTDTISFSIFDVDGTMDGEIVRTLVSGASVPSDPSSCFLNGKPTTVSYWNKLKAKTNHENIPDTVEVKYGFSTKRSSLRAFPSYDFIGEDKDDRFFDVMVYSEFMPFCPLLVLHESSDGNWLYVMFEGFSGWVHKSYVAVCDSKEDWLERANPDEFLVVTGRELRLQDDVRSPSLSGSLLPMGTKLPLVDPDDAPDFINDRETKGCYIVKLPVRNSDGSIADKYSLISVKEDVNVGYLDYTYNNVVRQAMKLYGDRYGWAGLNHSNDCSGITGEIFRCFGIKLPRTSGTIASFNGRKTFDVSEYSVKRKTNLLEKVPAGSILFFRGHIMIFLGVYEGDPYCISAIGTYCDKDGNMYDTNSVMISNMNETYRADGNTWLSHIQKIIVV